KQKQQQRLKNLQRPPANGGLVGLNNLGNTCYMNSILQCLSHTEPLLRHFVLERRFQPSAGRNGSGLAKAYANLMLRMWAASASPTGADCTSPTELKQCVAQYAPRFRGYSQQDAQEFLRYLLEGLHEDLNLVSVRPKLPPRYLQQENSPVVEAFVGQLKSTLECCHCSHKSVTFDPFWDLALPIPGKSRTSLDACLKLFTNQETLDGNERPTCDRCRCRRKCVKRFHLYRLPSVLVIHLMRFSGERFKTKLNTLVEYPMELDVSEFLDKKCRLRQTPQYRLYAVSEHAGTPYGGHYTAVVRHAGTGRWLRYNDNRVEEASTRSVVSTEGYVLFYSRVDSQPAEEVGDDDNEGDDPVRENGEDEENTEKHVMANGNH
uniref:ubiquitinyl hydrolase 1 n=1 Tax=Macrostomum lignano TaxID=282301 RepID=A0A1I8G214_9PLAT